MLLVYFWYTFGISLAYLWYDYLLNQLHCIAFSRFLTKIEAGKPHHTTRHEKDANEPTNN